jgi:MinD superfamily P-loop ATPase
MLELALASGKGGTGKTSLVGALAELVGPTVLVDCDVDAADLHLIVPHRVIEKHDFRASFRASINVDKCTGCGLCIEQCRFSAISMKPDQDVTCGIRFTVDPLACEGCGLCAHLCAPEAINFEEIVSGKWFLSESDLGPFLHAQLGVAQSNSGRLVSLLRQKAKEIADAQGHSTVIVDGPPGIGCPTIATITNASYLLIVTEPSVSALHDMERLADLATHFKIRCGIFLNKCDINEKIANQIEKLAAKRKLPIHGKLPYDSTFTQAQLKGRTYAHSGSAAGIEVIRNTWKSVLSNAGYKFSTDKQRFAV